MKTNPNIDNGSQFNQFMDVKTMRSSKCINRLKNYNLDNAKISLRKLPADFFQPSTNSNKNLNVIHIVNRQSILKTPSFGTNKNQLASLSIIGKDKTKIQIQKKRMLTTFQQQTDNFYRVRTRKNLSQQMEKIQKQQKLLSHRQFQRQKTNIENCQQWSTEKSKIKYKKPTINNQIYLEFKKVKKPLRQQTEFVSKSKKNMSRRNSFRYQQKLKTGFSNQKKMGKLPPLF